MTAADGRSLVVHVGMNKTGTTSIQHFLRMNRAALADAGWLYPRSPGNARHMKLGLAVRDEGELANTRAWVDGGFADVETFRRRFRRRLATEVGDAGTPSVILSDEYLWQSRHLDRLRGITDHLAERMRTISSVDVRVVAYLRRQDDHLVSSYQQGVKSGGVERLSEVARAGGRLAYQYARKLDELRAAMAAPVVVRRFDRSRFVEGSLHQDFLDAAGVPLRAADLAEPERRNESLDAESVEFLRIHNLFLVEHRGARARLIRNAGLIGPLMEHGTGPVLTLPDTVLEEFMARWAEGNARVAREEFGEDDLFAADRRTTNTTTVQRLDPARVDHFLDLLDVPSADRPLIRAIAEREARVADAEGAHP